MEEKNNHLIYVAIGHVGRGADYTNEILYTGFSKEQATEPDLFSHFSRAEVQVWKNEHHIRTFESEQGEHFKTWTRPFDLETDLKAKAYKLGLDLSIVQQHLEEITGKGETNQ